MPAPICTSEEQEFSDETTISSVSPPSSPVVKEKREMLEQWAKRDFLDVKSRPAPSQGLVMERHKWLADQAHRRVPGMVNASEIVVSQDVHDAKKRWKSKDERIQNERQRLKLEDPRFLSSTSRDDNNDVETEIEVRERDLSQKCVDRYSPSLALIRNNTNKNDTCLSRPRKSSQFITSNDRKRLQAALGPKKKLDARGRVAPLDSTGGHQLVVTQENTVEPKSHQKLQNERNTTLASQERRKLGLNSAGEVTNSRRSPPLAEDCAAIEAHCQGCVIQ